MKNKIIGKTAGLVSVLLAAAAAVMFFTACEDTLMRQDYKTMSGVIEWDYKATLDAGPDAVDGAWFGGPGSPYGEGGVDIDGDWLIIGADGENTGRGAAYFFRFENGSWKKKQRVTASDGNDWDAFGYSVAISGSLAAVGAPFHDSEGSVYLYIYNGTGWTEAAASPLSGPGTEANDQFGSAAALDGDYLVVGDRTADSQNTGAADEGAAYVFYRNKGGSDVWGWQAILTAESDAADDDSFGNSVDIEGSYIVVGAFGSDEGAYTNCGAAYVFHRDGSTWTRTDRLIESGIVNDDYLGSSVAISGDLIAVGAKGQDKVYTYKRSGSNWVKFSELTTNKVASGDEFGYCVDIFEHHLIVGAHKHATNSLIESGSAYAFYYVSEEWVETATLLMNSPSVEANFGHTIAISDDMAVIGAPYDDGGGTDRGSVTVFEYK